MDFRGKLKYFSTADVFGSLSSYEDLENGFFSWEECLLNEIRSVEDAISKIGIFSLVTMALLNMKAD